MSELYLSFLAKTRTLYSLSVSLSKDEHLFLVENWECPGPLRGNTPLCPPTPELVSGQTGSFSSTILGWVVLLVLAIFALSSFSVRHRALVVASQFAWFVGKIFAFRKKFIVYSQRLHRFFVGPKGPLIYLCSLFAAHFDLMMI